jgi:aldehyde dehydrogenase (NAD+)
MFYYYFNKGGKSPTIIDESCQNLEISVKRIIAGKFLNAGQVCISPDYVYCHEKVFFNSIYFYINEISKII